MPATKRLPESCNATPAHSSGTPSRPIQPVRGFSLPLSVARTAVRSPIPPAVPLAASFRIPTHQSCTTLQSPAAWTL